MPRAINNWTDTELQEIEHYTYNPDARAFAAEVLRLRGLVRTARALEGRVTDRLRYETKRAKEAETLLAHCRPLAEAATEFCDSHNFLRETTDGWADSLFAARDACHNEENQ